LREIFHEPVTNEKREEGRSIIVEEDVHDLSNMVLTWETCILFSGFQPALLGLLTRLPSASIALQARLDELKGRNMASSFSDSLYSMATRHYIAPSENYTMCTQSAAITSQDGALTGISCTPIVPLLRTCCACSFASQSLRWATRPNKRTT